MSKQTPWRITMNKKVMTRKPPHGPNFSNEEAESADSMSILLFEAQDSQDYVKYTLYDKNGKILKEKTTHFYEL
jgi:hypothetical protein